MGVPRFAPKKLGGHRPLGMGGSLASLGMTGVSEQLVHQLLSTPKHATPRLAARFRVGGDNGQEHTFADLLRSEHSMPSVTLYTRARCHLCDIAKGVIWRRCNKSTRLSWRSSTSIQNPSWKELYGHEVPVVFVNERKAFKYRVKPRQSFSNASSAPHELQLDRSGTVRHDRGRCGGCLCIDGRRWRATARPRNPRAIPVDPQYTGQNRTAPDFDLVDQHGEHRHLTDYRGKTVVLHFWTRTCGPCIQELQSAMPAFEEMVKDRPELALLMVSVDSGWAADAPIVPGTVNSPILFDPTRSVVTGKFGTRLFPETWVIDARGVIRARFDHAIEWDSPLWINYLASIR